MDQIINICMGLRESDVIPACAAIQSLADSRNEKEHYNIFLVTADLTEEQKKWLEGMAGEGLIIYFLKTDFGGEFQTDLSATVQSADSAKDQALYEASDWKAAVCGAAKSTACGDRLLYLDSCLIIKENLRELYRLDLEGNFCGAVADCRMLYEKKQPGENTNFNTGVLLFDLQKMRTEQILEKLEKAERAEREQETENTWDEKEDIWQTVFDGRVKKLPIRYNFMADDLYRYDTKWLIRQVNENYGTAYENKKEMYEDAAILHYAKTEGPWKDPDGACAAQWLHAYFRAPIPHELAKPPEEAQPYGISVIMPCYNAQKYLEATMESILAQTFQNFEIICINDGSADGTLEILTKYAAADPRIKVFSDTNHGQGYQRNRGIEMAQGKYIYYMDSDDLLEPDCFAVIYQYAEENRLDLLYFEGTAFYESAELEEQFPNYKWLYKRRAAYPAVYTGEELYVKFRAQERIVLIVSPCLQLVRREYLNKYHIRFPQLHALEDNLYTLKALLQAKRVMCLSCPLFNRRVRYGSTMTKDNSLEKAEALTAIMQEVLKEFVKYKENEPVYYAISSQLKGYFNNFRTYYDQLVKKNGEEFIYHSMPAQQWELMVLSLLMQVEDTKQKNLNEKLKRAYKEKSELNAKLQRTYREKSQLNGKLRQAYKEKTELNEKLGQAYREKSELNRKLQITYKEKSERGERIKELEKQKSRMEHSTSYKLGRCITAPVRKIKKKLKK